MRPAVLVCVALLAVGLAWVATRAAPPPPRNPPTSAPYVARTATGLAAGAYLDFGPAERLALARGNLERMANDLPERLGPLKEEIALVCDDADVVALVAGAFPAARAEGGYRQAAFADIFALVKRPEFTAPVAELLDSEDRFVRAKGVQAAETQAAPELLPHLRRAYARSLAEAPEETPLTRHLIVLIAARAGGAEASAILQAALRDPAADVVSSVLAAAAEKAWPGLVPDVRDFFLQTKNELLKVKAAAALRDDPEARRHLLSRLDPRDQALAFEAAALVIKTRPAGALEALRERRGAGGEAGRAIRTALISFGDEEARDAERAALAGSNLAAEVDALGVLIQAGDVEATPALVASVARGGPDRLGAAGAALRASGIPEFLPVVEALVAADVAHPADIGEAAGAYGDAIVPKLAAELARATTDRRRRFLAACLLDVGTFDARRALLARRAEAPHVVEPAVRLLDLGLRRRGF